MNEYLAPGRYIDSSHPAVREFSKQSAKGEKERERAVSLYYAVRDKIRYNPFLDFADPLVDRSGFADRLDQEFDTVEVLTKGGPNKATEVLIYTMYTEGFSFFRTGYASAVTVVFVVIVLFLTLVQVRLGERRTHYA